jgi:glycerol-3-phosphate dehydrogenase (NAD(P)+)
MAFQAMTSAAARCPLDECVAVIGSGSWGTTLAKVAAENGRKVLLWARRQELSDEINQTHRNESYLPGFELPATLEATTDLERICRSATLLILVVPSHGLRRVAAQLGDFSSGEHVIVHASKGIERESHKRMSELLREETCVRKIGVLSGPNLAREIALRQPAGTLIASRYQEVFRRCQAVLNNGYFRAYASEDVIGAEVGGAFKNVVALAAGVATGLDLGDNSKALLITRGLAEMARLGVAMGAEVSTFAGMAGIGDLIATCSSTLSRNHQVGVRLARGESLEQIQAHMQMVAEGVRTTRAVQDFALQHRLELPIVRAVHRLLYEGCDLETALTDLMATPTGMELSAWR